VTGVDDAAGCCALTPNGIASAAINAMRFTFSLRS
jgi:hypothetical protein